MAIKLSIEDISEINVITKALSVIIRGGDALFFNGELGAGKTAFIKGLCGHLGIDKRLVTSPTFSILHIYNANEPISIVHADIYRLGEGADITEIGLVEYLEEPSFIVMVEWAEFLDAELISSIPHLDIFIGFHSNALPAFYGRNKHKDKNNKDENCCECGYYNCDDHYEDERRRIILDFKKGGWQDREDVFLHQIKKGGIYYERVDT